MGLIAGLIAAPCTGPVLIFILTLVSIDGNFLTAIYLMILYALGMGIPFLFLGTFSSIISYIPKSGQWMNIVKDIFGLSIFGGAIYYLGCAFNHFAQVIGSFSKNILGFYRYIIYKYLFFKKNKKPSVSFELGRFNFLINFFLKKRGKFKMLLI